MLCDVCFDFWISSDVALLFVYFSNIAQPTVLKALVTITVDFGKNWILPSKLTQIAADYASRQSHIEGLQNRLNDYGSSAQRQLDNYAHDVKWLKFIAW